MTPDVLNALAGRFFSPRHWLGAIPIGSGHINDTYRIDCEENGQRQSFVLQRLNHQVFRQPQQVAANIRAVADYLADQDYPYRIARPVPGLDGQDLQRDAAGQYWRVFPFFAHTFAPENAADPGVAYEAARAYGAFLRALRAFPADSLAETIPGFHDTGQRWTVFTQVLANDPVGRATQAAVELEKIKGVKPLFEAVHRLNLPRRVTHNDTKAGNVLFDQTSRKAVAVIDWDTVMPGTVLSDFGDMVRTFVPVGAEDSAQPVVLREGILPALCEGFLAETGDFLEKTERTNLPLGAQWIIGEQALRFLTDYLAGDVYYKIHYPEHNLVRARNQLDLLEKITAEEGRWPAY